MELADSRDSVHALFHHISGKLEDILKVVVSFSFRSSSGFGLVSCGHGIRHKNVAHTEVRTRAAGFKVLCANHYTIRACSDDLLSCQVYEAVSEVRVQELNYVQSKQR